jgi:hypothetical protein
MIETSGQRSDVSSQKSGFSSGLTLSPMRFALGIVGAVLLALSLPAQAHQPTKVPRIGYLSPGTSASSPASFEAFRRRLHDLGYVEGKNIVIKHLFAEGKHDQLPKLAAELVSLKVELIVVVGGQAAEAAKQATNSIPIVFTLVNDPSWACRQLRAARWKCYRIELGLAGLKRKAAGIIKGSDSKSFTGCRNV